MKLKLSLLVIFVFLFFNVSLAAKILFLFPTVSPSHLIVTEALTAELTKRGHEITIFSLFPVKNIQEKHRYFTIEDPSFKDRVEDVMGGLVNNSGSTLYVIKQMPKLMNICFDSGKALLEDPKFKKLMKDETFDLVVLNFLLNEYFVGVAEHFNCPAIIVSAGNMMASTSVLFGNPLEVSAVPNFYLTKYKPMNFIVRVLNFLIMGPELLFAAYYHLRQRNVYIEYFPPDKYPSYEEALKRLSLFMYNQHFTIIPVRPLLPSMIEIGGFQVPDSQNPLPEDLQKWIDDSKDGVIFMNFGTNAKSNLMPQEKISAMMRAFSKLKQRVIFKWESDDLPDKPKNVLIKNWLPQMDILAHKNVKLFVSHCGLGSLNEAKHHEVPVLATPLFGDQMKNAENIVAEGWALQLDFDSLTEEKFSEKIHELLNNETYKTTVRKLSQFYKDRPLTALQTAVFWTEYVIRHKGASHMRYPGADLNLIQRFSLDVVAFLAIVLYVSLKITKFVLKLILRKFVRFFNRTTESSKKRN